MRDRLTLHLTAPVILISLVLLALAGVTAWYIHKLQSDTAALVKYSVKAMGRAEELDRVAREVETKLNRFLATREPTHLEDVQPLGDRMRLLLEEAGKLPLPLDARQMIDRIRRETFGFFGELDDLARRSASQERRRALRALVENRTWVRVRAPVQEYLQYAQRELTEAGRSQERVAGFLGLGLLVLGACGAGAGLVVGYGIARRISRSIVQLSVPIRDVAGKLNRVVGPVNVSTTHGIEEWESVLKKIAGEVETVVTRLQKTQQDALRAEQLAAVGQLAAGMAHELLNPLTAIKMIVQSAIEKGETGGVAGRDLAVLREQITRQERSIRSFLEYARPRELELRPLDARRAVEEAVELAASRARRQDVEIEWSAPEESVPIEGDVEQLGRVFLNLLLNALEAMPGGGRVRVTMAKETMEEEGRRDGSSADGRGAAVVQVSDTGDGLPADLEEKIFDPFVSTRETGMGLGLSISKRIIEMHGGTITAANGPAADSDSERQDPDRAAGGAVFTVRLPLRVEEATGTPVGADETGGRLTDAVRAGPGERGDRS